MDLVYKNEKPLFLILAIISIPIWIALIVGTMGIALVYILFFFLFYLFAQSAFISHLKGTAVRITPEQFPDLHRRIADACRKLDMADVPDAYLMHVGGTFNALATRFLGRNFIVLFSDVVDALESKPDALNFYIGHELGHIKRNHLKWGPVLFPAAILPLVGAAYSRAREYTCDLHGLAACADGASARYGLAVLAAGGKRWESMDQGHYMAQSKDSGGFWMSLHELISDYPWLTKRLAAVNAQEQGQEARHPSRNPLAWLLALFVPRLGMGGGAASVLVMVAIVGVLAAIAIPAYQEYIARAKLVAAEAAGRKAADLVANYYYANGQVPQTLEQAGFSTPPEGAGVSAMAVDPGTGVIRVTLGVAPYSGKSLVLVPSLDAEKRVVWRCVSDEIPAKALPPDCRNN